MNTSITQFVRTPWTGNRPDARPPLTQDNSTQKNVSIMPRAEFEPIISLRII